MTKPLTAEEKAKRKADREGVKPKKSTPLTPAEKAQKNIDDVAARKSKKKSKAKPKVTKKEVGHPMIKGRCKFNGVGFGDGKANVSVTIDRKVINIKTADENFCKARCEITMSLGEPDQGQLPEMGGDNVPSIKAFCNIHKISFDRKNLGFSMSFDITDIPARIKSFSYQNGQVNIRRVGEAGEEQGKNKVTPADNPQTDLLD